MRRPFTVALVFGAAVLFVGVSARADGSGQSATAQLLFDEGRALTKKGDYAAACPKFVESHKLDPAGGTILHAADCHQSEGKLATAWTEYNEALSFAVRDRRADREKIAREQIAALAPKLGKLKITVSPEARSAEALTITIDGNLFDRAGWDAPIPLDGGKHVVDVFEPGHLHVKSEVVITDGGEASLSAVRPPVDPNAPSAGAPSSSPASSSSSSSSSKENATGGARPGDGQRRTGLIVGGVGAVGTIVGVVFGIRAASIGDQSSKCTLGPRNDGCPQSAVDDQDSARSSALISTIGFIAGGALLVAGGVLYFTAPSSSTRIGVAFTPTGIVLRGSGL
jgi:hypothetical protein